MLKICITGLVLMVCWNLTNAVAMNDTKQLLEALFADYSSEVRPVNNTDSVLTITVAFSLVSLQNLDQKDQSLLLNGLFQFSWTDVSLVWNPADYDGLTYTIVKQKRLWMPDIVLRNSVTGSRLEGHPDTPISVANQGKVNWNVIKSFKTSCSVDVTFFPFDTQLCTVSLSSFIHTESEIRLTVDMNNIDLDNFNENGQWIVKSTSVSSGTLPSLPVSEAKFGLVLERRASSHILTTLFPIVVLSLLTTTVFLVPPDSGERLTLSVILFLCFIVFLLFLDDYIPKTAQNVAIIAIYAYVELALSAVAVILSVFVVRTSDKQDMSRVPRWLQNSTRWFRALFCWARRKNKKWMFPSWRNHFIVNHWSSRSYHLTSPPNEELDLDWMDVAEVLDRLIYVIFLLLTLLSTIICLSLMIHRW